MRKQTLTLVKYYLDASMQVEPSRGKAPIRPGWNTATPLTLNEIIKHDRNAHTLVIPKNMIVVDVDKKHGGLDSLHKLCKIMNLELSPTVKTGGGGFHIYLRAPEGIAIKKYLPDYPGVEFLGFGHGCMMAGSVLADNAGDPDEEYRDQIDECDDADFLFYELEDPRIFETMKDIPPKLLDMIKEDAEPVKLVKPHSFLTIKEVNKYLDYVTGTSGYDCDLYPDWIRVGLMLFNWDSVDSEERFKIWDSWSARSDKYDSKEVKKFWDGFTPKEGGKISLGTLIYDYKQLKAKKNENTDHIWNYGAIEEDELHPFQINAINEKATWAYYIVYVATRKSPYFYNYKTGESWDNAGFNFPRVALIPLNENGKRPKPDTYAANNQLIPTVSEVEFNPLRSPGVFLDNGVLKVNTFNHNAILQPAPFPTEAGNKMGNAIVNHIKFMLGEEHALTLVDWIAHNVQYMGKKIRWMPLIQSVQGTGKSMIAKMLGKMLAPEYVKPVESKGYTSGFGDWTRDRLVNILEEIKLPSEARTIVPNTLKPLISDDIISVSIKHKDGQTLRNFCNYIGFTNYSNALIITDDDRRYFIVNSPVRNVVRDVEEFAGCKHDDYFTTLNHYINDHPDKLKRFFLDYPIRESFFKHVRAPLTADRQELLDSQKVETEYYDETFEYLSNVTEESKMVNKLFIIPSRVFAHLEKFYNVKINNHKRRKITLLLGYEYVPKAITHQNDSFRPAIKMDVLDEFISRNDTRERRRKIIQDMVKDKIDELDNVNNKQNTGE